jgi:hypothetical protein
MSKGYKPTAYIKWFRVEGNYADNEKPLAQVANYRGLDTEWYCLKQLWISDYEGEPNKWRDIEIVL